MGNSTASLGPEEQGMHCELSLHWRKQNHSPPARQGRRPRRRGPRPGGAARGPGGAARGPGGAHQGAGSHSGLSLLVKSEQPMLLDIAKFLCETPADFTGLCCACTQFGKLLPSGPIAKAVWRELYCNRWPCFFECLTYQGAEDWKGLYRDTAAGCCEFVLEVFDREKKLGFAMSAMPARVSYLSHYGWGCYVVRYLSAKVVPPEMIPVCEEHRLRFCPASARPQLRPCGAPAPEDGAGEYPNRVLQGFDGLKVGGSVELQWKMQPGSPFGWWYGRLDWLQFIGDGLAEGTIIFPHFPAASRWHRLTVRFGDAQMRECAFGGLTGGVRSVSPSEQKQFMRFFPGELVVV